MTSNFFIYKGNGISNSQYNTFYTPSPWENSPKQNINSVLKHHVNYCERERDRDRDRDRERQREIHMQSIHVYIACLSDKSTMPQATWASNICARHQGGVCNTCEWGDMLSSCAASPTICHQLNQVQRVFLNTTLGLRSLASSLSSACWIKTCFEKDTSLGKMTSFSQITSFSHMMSSSQMTSLGQMTSHSQMMSFSQMMSSSQMTSLSKMTSHSQMSFSQMTSLS